MYKGYTWKNYSFLIKNHCPNKFLPFFKRFSYIYFFRKKKLIAYIWTEILMLAYFLSKHFRSTFSSTLLAKCLVGYCPSSEDIYLDETFGIFTMNLLWVSDWLTFNAKWGILQLYQGENTLHFNDSILMSALY